MKLRVTFTEEQSLAVKFMSTSDTFNYSFGEIHTITNVDYNVIHNKPSINGVELIGDKTGEDLHLGSAVFPSGGSIGDLLSKVNGDDVGWITPANSAEQDNTRPITAAAVYLEIGNINALLHTI